MYAIGRVIAFLLSGSVKVGDMDAGLPPMGGDHQALPLRSPDERPDSSNFGPAQIAQPVIEQGAGDRAGTLELQGCSRQSLSLERGGTGQAAASQKPLRLQPRLNYPLSFPPSRSREPVLRVW